MRAVSGWKERLAEEEPSVAKLVDYFMLWSFAKDIK